MVKKTQPQFIFPISRSTLHFESIFLFHAIIVVILYLQTAVENTFIDTSCLVFFHFRHSQHRVMSHRRLSILQAHLNSTDTAEHDEAQTITRHPTSAWLQQQHQSRRPSTNALYLWLVRDNREMREAIFDFLKDPIYRPNHTLSLAGTRELCSQRVIKFYQQRFFSISDYNNNPLKFQAALESLSFADYALSIKSGVHATLCGGTIAKLGTERHHREILPKMDTLELPGCYCLTELGHGSNAVGIETTATYDPTTQEFIINTPTNAASKYWIGGAAHTAKITTCFAQLTINGRWEGPHAFVVRMRDDAGNMMPGVRAADNGPKMGLNGVDNGQVWFSNVRVPRDALLDRYAQVSPDGSYSSPIANPQQRFGVVVSGLTTGRMLIAQAAVDACKSGITIAIRYAVNRPQFGDKTIMEYVTHQRRLIPALATTYALHLSMIGCKNLGLQGAGTAKQVHVLSSGLKAAATWHRVKILQDCRECCGGMGVKAENKIGPMMNDMNVDTTFEGDNTVMMQQMAKPLVSKSRNTTTTSSPSPKVNAMDLGLSCISALLSWRQTMLAVQASQEIATSQSNNTDGAGDVMVALGWAAVDAHTFDTFVKEIQTNNAPAEWKGTLTTLALLYGLCRVEEGLVEYLGGGALPGGAVPSLRRKINAVCAGLAADGAAVALDLCDAFGIPDHLLQAPIALGDWRTL